MNNPTISNPAKIASIIVSSVLQSTPRAEEILANPPAFATMSEFEEFVRTVYRPYGWQSDAQWRRMAETSARRLPDGRITAHYDPAVTRQFVAHPDDYQQWEHYDRVEAPTLLLRGAASDLLPAEVRRLHGLRSSGLAQPGVAAATFGLASTLRWALAPR